MVTGRPEQIHSSVAQSGEDGGRTFVVGERAFLLDGEPFVIRCGEIHFPRVPREYWRHRLRMIRALGLNAACLYLFWNFHEWEEGAFDWTGQADAAAFCRMAQEEGLWVILRPGPYACAEWEMGGLPWWLTKHDGIGLRSTDPRFLEPATRYLHEVGRVLGSQQISQGGPILMVQVENEYGSFGTDAVYMGAIRQALLDGGFDVPLFACNPMGDLANGYRQDLFQVVNFGAGASEPAFRRLREFQPAGPLMNGEYYPAWFDMWGRKHRTGAVEPIVSDLGNMLAKGRSFSLYMAHGGTSFGLWAGADRPFSPDTTSYDYDAPISEAGWVTPKFQAIRAELARHLQPGETLPEPPPPNPVIEIPPFELNESAPIFENLPAPIQVVEPRTMEIYGQSRGATLYRTTLPSGEAEILSAAAVHDFAWAFLDGRLIGVMDRRRGRYRLELPRREAPAQLDLLVYAMGRVNFGEQVFDRKGLHLPVRLAERNVEDWQVFPLPLDSGMLQALRYGPPVESPAFWRGAFALETVGDTFLDLSSWGKGVVWVNGRCLGRFWNIGPTQTLYLPGPWLRKGRNEVVVLDLIGARDRTIAGRAAPILDELHPELDFSRPTRVKGTFTAAHPVVGGTFTVERGWQQADFGAPVQGRYLAVEALTAHNGSRSASISGLDALDPHGQPIPRSGWQIHWASSEETNYLPGEAEHAIDGQASTYWHSEAGASALPPPHRLIVDLGESRALGGIRYLPRSGDASATGLIRDYRVYVSDQPFGLDSNS